MNNRIPFATLPALPKKAAKTPCVKKGPPDQKLVLAYIKERLEALIHDERYEEAGKLAVEVRNLKEVLKEKSALKEAWK